MAASAKVIQMFDHSLTEDIKGFLRKKRNTDTRAEYHSLLNRFFQFHCKKDIEYVTMGDLIIKQSIVENYRLYLQTKTEDKKALKKTAVDKAVSVIRGLYTYLASNDYPVKAEWFQQLESIPDDSGEYATFTWEETERAIASTLKRYKSDVKEKGDMKAVMIETAFVTSLRLNELRRIRPSSFKHVEDQTWEITVRGKRGKILKSPITDELYEKIMAVSLRYADPENNPQGFIFQINDKTVGKMVKYIVKDLGLTAEEGQRYVFHSFKSGGINEVGRITGGDVKEMQSQGKHNDPSTTFKHYAKLKRNIHSSPNLRIGKKVDIIPQLEKLSKEEILSIIAKSGRFVHYELERLLK